MFLDEIGNLSLEVQQMLLRALEAKRYRPIGGNKEKTADVRIIGRYQRGYAVSSSRKAFPSGLVPSD